MPVKSRPSDELQTERLSAKSRLANAHRRNSGATAEEKDAARQDLVVANIAAYASGQVARAPKLSQEQIDRIVSVLRDSGAP